MKKMMIVALMLLSVPAFAKEKDPRVVAATVARDNARRAVLQASIAVAKAKAVLAEAQLHLTQAKYDAGAGAAEAEKE